MKKIIFVNLILVIAFFSSCSKDDENDPRTNYPKKVDVEFSVTSTKNSIYSTIATSISSGTDENGNTDLDLKETSYSKYHLPFKRIYVAQTVGFFDTLNLSYADDSITDFTDVFEEYTVELEIKVDGKIVASETITIEENGQGTSINYTFLE